MRDGTARACPVAGVLRQQQERAGGVGRLAEADVGPVVVPPAVDFEVGCARAPAAVSKALRERVAGGGRVRTVQAAVAVRPVHSAAAAVVVAVAAAVRQHRALEGAAGPHKHGGAAALQARRG